MTASGMWGARLLSERSVALWTVLAGIAGVVALFLAVAQLAGGDQRQAAAPSPTGPGAPALKLAALATDRTAEIDGRAGGDSELSGPARDVRVEGAVLDITLRNDGDLPSLVTGIRVTLRRADQLEPCIGLGGSSGVTARYQVDVPNPPPALPARLDRPVRFEVLPRSIDRLTVSIGPAEIDARLEAYVYVADVELVHDTGQRLPVGRVAVAVPPAFSPEAPSPIDAGCAARMRQLLARASAEGGEVSPRIAELDALYAAATR